MANSDSISAHGTDLTASSNVRFAPEAAVRAQKDAKQSNDSTQHHPDRQSGQHAHPNTVES
jgi:hypothetical protein